MELLNQCAGVRVATPLWEVLVVPQAVAEDLVQRTPLVARTVALVVAVRADKQIKTVAQETKVVIHPLKVMLVVTAQLLVVYSPEAEAEDPVLWVLMPTRLVLVLEVLEVLAHITLSRVSPPRTQGEEEEVLGTLALPQVQAE